MTRAWLVAATVLFLGASDSKPRPREVRMTEDRFEPASLELKAGESVRWRNTALRVHTVTGAPSTAGNTEDASLPKGAQEFDSGYLGIGETFTYRFTVPGTYRYFCTLHASHGMVGTVTVRP